MCSQYIELYFVKCCRQWCGELITCAVQLRKRLAAVWVTGGPFQGSKGNFIMFVIGPTGWGEGGCHLNVNYKRVLTMLYYSWD